MKLKKGIVVRPEVFVVGERYVVSESPILTLQTEAAARQLGEQMVEGIRRIASFGIEKLQQLEKLMEIKKREIERAKKEEEEKERQGKEADYERIERLRSEYEELRSKYEEEFHRSVKFWSDAKRFRQLEREMEMIREKIRRAQEEGNLERVKKLHSEYKKLRSEYEELRPIIEDVIPIFDAIGGIISPPGMDIELVGIAPPEGKTWGDIKQEIESGKGFSLRVIVSGRQVPIKKKKEEASEEPEGVTPEITEEDEEGKGLAKARRRRPPEKDVIVLATQLIDFKPIEVETQEGEKRVIWSGQLIPSEAQPTISVEYSHQPVGSRKEGEILTEEEAQEILGEIQSEEDIEQISLEELKVLEEGGERRTEEGREEEEDVTSLWEHLVGRGDKLISRNLLKEVLLKKLDELLMGILRKDRKWATEFFRKSKREER